MHKKLFSALGVVLAVSACSSSPLPDGTDPKNVLGSYHLRLAGPGGTTRGAAVLRLDLAKNEKGELYAYLQDQPEPTAIHRATAVLDATALTLEWKDADGTSASYRILRDDGGRFGTLTGKRSVSTSDGRTTQEDVTGTVSPDEDAPRVVAKTGAELLPWEEARVAFSEGVYEKDLTLPRDPRFSTSIVPLAGTPWVIGARVVATSTWEGLPESLPGAVLIDPAKNKGEAAFPIAFAKVGPAVRGYDFDRDEPAWKPSTIDRSSAGCGGPRCFVLTDGGRLGLRVKGGQSKLVLELVAHTNDTTEGASLRIPVSVRTTPLGGSTTEILGVDVPFTTGSDAPSGAMRFHTETFELPVALPSGSEVGVTVTLATPKSGPRFELAVLRARVE